MNKMKRTISLLLALSMVFIMSACSMPTLSVGTGLSGDVAFATEDDTMIQRVLPIAENNDEAEPLDDSSSVEPDGDVDGLGASLEDPSGEEGTEGTTPDAPADDQGEPAVPGFDEGNGADSEPEVSDGPADDQEGVAGTSSSAPEAPAEPALEDPASPLEPEIPEAPEDLAVPGDPETALPAVEADPVAIEYWIEIPKTVVGNYDIAANDGRFLVRGDDGELAGHENNHPDGRWFSTDHDKGMALLYVFPGKTYEIEIVNDPNNEYEEKFGLICDERVMKVAVSVGEDGRVTTSNRRFELPDGSTPGNQESFIIKAPVQDSVWTEDEVIRARNIMFDMTLEEKVGQLFLVHYPGDGSGSIAQANAVIDNYHPGGFLVFAAMFNGSTPDVVKNKTNAAQAHSKIPMLFSVDEEGGKVTRISQYPAFRSSKFPFPQDLANQGVDAVEADATEKANLLRGLGLWVNHAPVADVSGPTGYIYARTYGQDGLGNSEYVAAAVRGHEENGVGSTLKHFPGYGGTSSNTHNGFAVNDLAIEDFEYNDLLPFYAGIGAGGKAVMVTHNIINAMDPNMPASLSEPVISYLRDTMGFDGVVMTDDLNMKAVTDTVGDGQASLACLQAGADMAMTAQPEKDYPVVLAAVKSGALSMERVNESCERVLCWKIRMGLIDLEITEPPVEETEAMWTNGAVTRYGTFAEMWALAVQNGGAVQLLSDASSGALTPSGKMTLNLNGHKLTLSDAAGIAVPSGVIFDIVDVENMQVTSTGAVVGTHRSPVVTSTPNGTETPDYNTVRRTLVWNEVDPDTGAKTQYEADFDALGTIVGTTGTAGIHVTGGTVNFESGVLSHPRQGVLMASGTVNISGGSILGCGGGAKPTDGGAVEVQGGTLSITAGYLGGNQASTRGGAICVGKNSGKVTVNGKDAVIACNLSGVQAGAIYVYAGGTLDFTKGRIASNSAGNGGAIYAYGGCKVVIGDSEAVDRSVVSETILTDNTARGQGGAIFMYPATPTVQVYGAAIVGNESIEGGGVRVGDNNANGGLFTISHSVVSYNSATNGGGIRFDKAKATTLDDVSIHHNTASGMGGGIWLNSTALTMDDAEIFQNSARNDGGGVWWADNTSTISLNGTVIIADNQLTDGTSDNVMLPVDCQFQLYKDVLVPGSMIRFEASVYPEEGQTVPVVIGSKSIIQNSQHAFELEDGLEHYAIVLHKTEGELDITTKVDGDQSVEVSGVLFQWYAPVRRLAVSGDSTRALKVIDTSAGEPGNRLPKNGSALPENAPTLRYLFLEPDGTVLYTEKLTPLYEAKDVTLSSVGSIESQWRFGASDHGYSRHQVWVATDGSKGLSTNPADWTVYNWHDGMSFTTEASQGDADTIYVGPGYVVRFVGGAKEDPEDIDAVFYDYDITNGQVYATYDDAVNHVNPLTADEIASRRAASQEMFVDTNGGGAGQGINSLSNYPVGTNTANAFGFGNGNTNMPWQNAVFGGNVIVNGVDQPSKLNAFNRTNFEGCTFGLTNGLSEDGVPLPSEGIKIPSVFGDGSAIGKTTYNDLSLRLRRHGNTLTLSEVTGADVTGLESFGHPGIYDGVQNKTVIWSNDFWPMDGKVQDGDGHDPVFGGSKDDVRFGQTSKLPASDDGLSHNSYFGMQFEIEFELGEDFIGPMAYTFFGDDDMWIFLDGEPIVDIGGVHRSVGMYVDLWDYLSREDAGTHKLSFFFTERGASGSTCWMNFCLPNIKSVASEPEIPEFGSLRIEKQMPNEVEIDQEFDFELVVDAAAGVYVGASCTSYTSNGEVKTSIPVNWDGTTSFSLKAGEYAVIDQIPVGTACTVRETETSALGYITTCNGSEGRDAMVTVGADPTNVVFVNTPSLMLPETGGMGVTWFYVTGLSAILGASFGLRRKKEEG